MWQDYVQALLTALGLSGLSFGVAVAVVRVGERNIEKRAGTVGIRDMLVRRARLEQALEARRVQRVAEIKALDGEVRDIIRRRQRLERQIADANSPHHRMIRQIGEEVEGSPCFIAMVVNKYVGTANFQQKQHAYVDRSWGEPQAIEVWTRSVQEARAEIERRYPPAFGYAITRLNEVGGASDSRPAKAS